MLPGKDVGGTAVPEDAEGGGGEEILLMAGREGADYARKQIAASTTGEDGTARDVDHFAFTRADAGERPLEDGHAAELARIGSRANVRSAYEASELTCMRCKD